jgi:hypothetical protein
MTDVSPAAASMEPGGRARMRRGHVRFQALLIGSFVLLAACSASPTTAPTATPPSATSAPATGSPAPLATPAAAGASASPSAAAGGTGVVPASCDALLVTVSFYTGSISGTQSLGKPDHLSCEFQYDGGKGLVIVNMGVGGTQAAFDTLKAGTAKGQTVTDVPNLGVAAFSVSKKGKPAGVTALSSNGILVVVESTLSENQDVELVNDLVHHT